MPWEPLAEWGPLDSDIDELSPPPLAMSPESWNKQEKEIFHGRYTTFSLHCLD